MQTITFQCRNGMLIRPDPTTRERLIECLADNRWSEPDPMFECFHSEYE